MNSNDPLDTQNDPLDTQNDPLDTQNDPLDTQNDPLDMQNDPLDTQIDVETESPNQRRRLIISLVWPSLAENILASLASMVDMIMVGGLGAYAIAAVGLVIQPKYILISAFTALNVGATALVARCKGARDRDGANDAFSQALVLTIAMTVIVCVVMLLTAEPLIRLIAGSELSEKTISEALVYFRIQIYGFPALSLTFAINASLRGAGNTRTTFYNNAVANIVNVGLNYCLINGNLGFPRMEVAGASLATILGQCVALAMAVRVAVGGRQYITLIPRKILKIDLKMMKRIANIGIPSLAEQTIMRVGVIWFTTIVTALGDVAYAAHMVAVNLQAFAFTTGMAFGTAATTLVGQSLGRKRDDLGKKYVRMSQNMCFVVSLAVAIPMFVFGEFFSGWYSDDMEIIGIAADMLKIVAATIPFVNARFVYASALRGAGDAKYIAAITFISTILIRPLLGILLVNMLKMELTGAWLALGADFVISFFITLFRYRQGKWTKIEI